MEKILVLDFGGQYNQLIARRVRDNHVFAEILPYTTPLENIRSGGYKGIIFTGGPNSVFDPASPHYQKEILELGVPILGICYGCQLICHMAGGEVKTAPSSEYGKITFKHMGDSPLFAGVPELSDVWMSHTDYIATLPQGFELIGKTLDCPVAAMQNTSQNIYAVQFHPEVTHSAFGAKMLENFLYRICGCRGDWVMDNFIENKIKELRDTIGDKNVILGLSGGVDSSVAAGLLSRAEVEKTFTTLFDMNFVRVNCGEHFMKALKGAVDPEQKRHIIGTEFFEVFWNEIRKQADKGYFAQGTIYPDCIESGKGDADVIKTHHNRVNTPADVEFLGILEPLCDLFKDEVRAVGEKLGIPKELVWRQPFPGPGLGVRIIGEITAQKVKILQDADWVLRDEMAKNGYEKELAQFFCVLPGVSTVGVMGDHRTYDHLVAIRAVTTDDFMTADWAKIPYDILAQVSNRITNECAHVNRVVYDITTKPPATVEWE